MSVTIYADIDPLTLTESGLGWVLTSHPAFAALVKAGNITILSKPEKLGRKDNRLNADAPELRLEPAGGIANTDNSSSAFGWTQGYNVQLLTNEKRTGGDAFGRDGINELKWAAIRAFARVRDGIPDLPFVKLVRCSGVSDAGPNINDNFDGWATLIRVDVKLIWAWGEIQV